MHKIDESFKITNSNDLTVKEKVYVNLFVRHVSITLLNKKKY